MANPVFNNNRAFSGAPGASQRGAQSSMSADDLAKLYGTPAASPAQTGRMTVDDVVMKTGMMFAVLLVGAAISWMSGNMLLMIVGMFGGLILGLVNSFKKEPSPALILAYSGLEGLFLGGFSWMVAQSTGGVDLVVYAVGATLAVFAVMLVAFQTGLIKNSPKFSKFMILAIGGYALFALVNFALVMFGVTGGAFNSPFGWVIGLVGAGLAAFSLIMDFDFVEQGVRRGLPEKYSWTAAFGLMVTLVWLYFEILRLLYILNSND